MKVNVNKTHQVIVAALAALMLPPSLAQAQDTSRNYVKFVTMLDAAETNTLPPGIYIVNGKKMVVK